MKRCVEGDDRHQVALLPECLDDFIAEDNPVRVVDAFVEELDLQALGFLGMEPAATGRPSYHPSVLLKIYIYGYLNRVQSSRRLEREAHRNVELMWLTGRLAPDFKTIADFRHDNGKGIRNVCRRFVELCRELKLFTQAVVAVDGSKFKAVNTRDRNFTPGKVKKRREQIDESIKRYLVALDTADRTLPPAEFQPRARHLKDKLATMREQMRRLRSIERRLDTEPDGQLSLTDRDAPSDGHQWPWIGHRGLQRPGRGGGHAPPRCCARRRQRRARSIAACTVCARGTRGNGQEGLQAVADRGYYGGPRIKACHEGGVAASLPKPTTSNAKAASVPLTIA